MSTTHQERIIKTNWEIDAPVADVWRALTDAEWLTNWFPTEARVTPGVGGTMFNGWSFGGEEFSADIVAWEEGRRLKLVYARPTPAAEIDAALTQGTLVPFEVAADYHLEANGDATVLRLVHSGFAEDEGWDWIYNATTRGWRFELGGLKHYLEKHRGVPRFVVQTRRALGDIALDVAWKMLFGAGGLLAQGATDALQEGERYTLRTSAGDTFEGVVDICNPPLDFAATVENLNDARLRIKIDRSCVVEGERDATFFLSTYGLADEQRETLQANVDSMFETLFNAAAPSTTAV